jgi:hypothetical protein
VTIFYAFAAQRIQSYIMATSQLTEMIGGSELVEKLCTVHLKEALAALGCEQGTRILNQAAGSARLEFSDPDRARVFHALWPFIASRLAPGLSISQAMVEEQGPDALQVLEEKLKAQRNSANPDLPETGPPMLVNARTGLAAVEEDKHDGPLEPALVCKRLAAKGSSVVRKLSPPADWDWTQKLDELAGGEAERTYVAIVHADGNGVGQTIQKLQETANRTGKRMAELFQCFSSALSKATSDAAAAALKAVKPLRLRTGRLLAPLRPVVLGGDDLTVIIQAGQALEFTRAFIENFERCSGVEFDNAFDSPEIRGELPPYLSACAGVCFVRANYPFSLGYELAEELCGFAKKGSKAQPGPLAPSSLAFHRVTTSLTGSYDRVLEDELSGFQVEGDLRLRLTGGPWALGRVESALPKLEALLELAKLLRRPEFARGKVRELLSELRRSRIGSNRHFDRMLQLLEEPKTSTLARQLEAQLDTLLGAGRDRAWTDRDPAAAWSPWGDAVLLNSIQRREAREQ